MTNEKQLLAERLFLQAFPQTKMKVQSIEQRKARIFLTKENITLRPGGTISGPTMMALADAVTYLAILGELGESGVMYVTSSFNINFLYRPKDGEIIA